MYVSNCTNKIVTHCSYRASLCFICRFPGKNINKNMYPIEIIIIAIKCETL